MTVLYDVPEEHELDAFGNIVVKKPEVETKEVEVKEVVEEPKVEAPKEIVKPKKLKK